MLARSDFPNLSESSDDLVWVLRTIYARTSCPAFDFTTFKIPRAGIVVRASAKEFSE